MGAAHRVSPTLRITLCTVAAISCRDLRTTAASCTTEGIRHAQHRDPSQAPHTHCVAPDSLVVHVHPRRPVLHVARLQPGTHLRRAEGRIRPEPSSVWHPSGDLHGANPESRRTPLRISGQSRPSSRRPSRTALMVTSCRLPGTGSTRSQRHSPKAKRPMW